MQSESHLLLIISLLADFGHVTPLAQAALSYEKNGGRSLAVVPPESAPLFNRYNLTYETLPEGSETVEKGPLHQLCNASEFRRSFDLRRKVTTVYGRPKQLNGLRNIEHAIRRISEINPDVLIADQHRFKDAYHHISRVTGVPLILFESYGTNFRAQLPYFGRKSPGALERMFLRGANSIGRGVSNALDIIDRSEKRKRGIMIRKEIDQINEGLKTAANYPQPCTREISSGICVLERKYLRNEILFNEHTQSMGPFEPHICWQGGEDIKRWIRDGPTAPIVYVAFGTMVAARPDQIKTIVDGALRNGARVLIAMQNPLVPNEQWPKDLVRHTEWAPQAAVLAEERVTVFVTHAGCMSVQEALWFGKSVLCIPKLWDQFYNSWVAEKLGVGIYRDCPDRTPLSVETSIQRLLTETRFRERAEELAQELHAARADPSFFKLVEETIHENTLGKC
jgi:hypothetical protein